jgi:signal transduction histidine kinase/ActR/RegA family two-component response regulator
MRRTWRDIIWSVIVSIRSKLVLLVLAVLTPALLAAALAISYVYKEQRDMVERSMREATRALALALDRDLSRRQAIVATLATSPDLRRGDLQEFYQQARQVAPSWDSSLVLYAPDGRQLLNTRRPLGDPLPLKPSSTREEMDTSEVISNLYMSQTSDEFSFAVRYPILRDGKLLYVISMSSTARQLSELMVEQGLPAGWLGAVVDRNGRIVARSRDADQHVGASATGALARQLSERTEGFVQSAVLDGVPMLSFFSRAPASRWAVVIAQPRHEVDRRISVALTVAILGVGLLLGVAIALAYWVGRKIARPLRILDATAQAMGGGQRIVPVATGMVETDRTARVLAQASEQIHQAREEMAARVAEAVVQAEQSQSALLQAQKLEALGRLTGGIAHDFNNLLQALTVGLQLALRSAGDPRAQRALEACMRSVARGSKLTAQLMAFGRHQVAESRVVDLRVLLLGMADLLDGALPSRIRLELVMPERPWPVYLDPLQCELALLNMLLNARDAIPGSGEIRLELGLNRLHEAAFGLEPGDYIELRVSDSGTGMSEEVRAKAFEPFYTTKPVGQGTGLGLAQVYGFVQASHGSVRIDSQLDCGTRITLLLPFSSQAPEVVKEESQLVKTSAASRCILLVDDDAQILELVESMLQELGYRVLTATSGEQALALYQRSLQADPQAGEQIDLLFSDIVMPGQLDGIGLALALRALRPGLPILLATGYSERAPADFGFKVLSKPYDARRLAEALERAFEGQAKVSQATASVD